MSFTLSKLNRQRNATSLAACCIVQLIHRNHSLLVVVVAALPCLPAEQWICVFVSTTPFSLFDSFSRPLQHSTWWQARRASSVLGHRASMCIIVARLGRHPDAL